MYDLEGDAAVGAIGVTELQHIKTKQSSTTSIRGEEYH